MREDRRGRRAKGGGGRCAPIPPAARALIPVWFPPRGRMLVASRDRVPPFTRVPRRAPGAAAAPGRRGDSELHGESGAEPAPAHPSVPPPRAGSCRRSHQLCHRDTRASSEERPRSASSRGKGRAAGKGVVSSPGEFYA